MHNASADWSSTTPSSGPARLFLVPPRVPGLLSVVPSQSHYVPIRPNVGKRMVLFAAIATPIALGCLLLVEHGGRL